MKRSYSGHVPVRVPNGWTGEARAMIIQLNSMIDDLYRRINELRKEVDKLKEEGEDNGGTDNESEPEET